MFNVIICICSLYNTQCRPVTTLPNYCVLRGSEILEIARTGSIALKSPYHVLQTSLETSGTYNPGNGIINAGTMGCS